MRIVDEFVLVAEPFVDLVGDDMHDVIADERQHDLVVALSLFSERSAMGRLGENAGLPALIVVPPAGFEPAAFCSGGRRSIP